MVTLWAIPNAWPARSCASKLWPELPNPTEPQTMVHAAGGYVG